MDRELDCAKKRPSHTQALPPKLQTCKIYFIELRNYASLLGSLPTDALMETTSAARL
jgi:hypothetical protein